MQSESDGRNDRRQPTADTVDPANLTGTPAQASRKAPVVYSTSNAVTPNTARRPAPPPLQLDPHLDNHFLQKNHPSQPQPIPERGERGTFMATTLLGSSQEMPSYTTHVISRRSEATMPEPIQHPHSNIGRYSRREDAGISHSPAVDIPMSSLESARGISHTQSNHNIKPTANSKRASPNSSDPPASRSQTNSGAGSSNNSGSHSGQSGGKKGGRDAASSGIPSLTAGISSGSGSGGAGTTATASVSTPGESAGQQTTVNSSIAGVHASSLDLGGAEKGNNGAGAIVNGNGSHSSSGRSGRMSSLDTPPFPYPTSSFVYQQYHQQQQHSQQPFPSQMQQGSTHFVPIAPPPFSNSVAASPMNGPVDPFLLYTNISNLQTSNNNINIGTANPSRSPRQRNGGDYGFPLTPAVHQQPLYPLNQHAGSATVHAVTNNWQQANQQQPPAAFSQGQLYLPPLRRHELSANKEIVSAMDMQQVHQQQQQYQLQLNPLFPGIPQHALASTATPLHPHPQSHPSRKRPFPRAQSSSVQAAMNSRDELNSFFRDQERLRDHEEYADIVGKCTLVIRQQPIAGRVTWMTDKNRPPLDPQPIIQLVVEDYNGTVIPGHQLQPFAVVHASLWNVEMTTELPLIQMNTGVSAATQQAFRSGSHSNPSTPDRVCRTLNGNTTMTGHEITDMDGQSAFLFLFPDLYVCVEGWFRLKFTLVQVSDNVEVITTECNLPNVEVFSDPFRVYSVKEFPGVRESTALSRHVASQGLKMPLRKDARYIPRESAATSVTGGRREGSVMDMSMDDVGASAYGNVNGHGERNGDGNRGVS